MVRSGSITKRRVRYLKLGRKSLAMADKSSATMDGSTSGDPHSLTEIEIPKELEAVNDILDFAERHSATSVCMAVETPKDCEEECLVLEADCKIKKPKKAMGADHTDSSTKSLLAKGWRYIGHVAVLLSKTSEGDIATYKLTHCIGEKNVNFKKKKPLVVTYDADYNITSGDDLMEQIIEKGPIKSKKRFIKHFKSMQNDNEIRLILPIKRLRGTPALKASADNNDINGLRKPFFTPSSLKDYLSHANLLPRMLLRVQSSTDELDNMLWIRSLCQSETIQLDIPSKSDDDDEAEDPILMTYGYTDVPTIWKSSLSLYKESRVLQVFGLPKRDRSKYQFYGMVHDVGDDSNRYEAIRKAAMEVFSSEYAGFKTLTTVKITKPHERWGQCKTCLKWGIVVSDIQEGSEITCKTMNVLKNCEEAEETLLPAVGSNKVIVPPTPARKRKPANSTSSGASTPKTAKIRAGTPTPIDSSTAKKKAAPKKQTAQKKTKGSESLEAIDETDSKSKPPKRKTSNSEEEKASKKQKKISDYTTKSPSRAESPKKPSSPNKSPSKTSKPSSPKKSPSKTSKPSSPKKSPAKTNKSAERNVTINMESQDMFAESDVSEDYGVAASGTAVVSQKRAGQLPAEQEERVEDSMSESSQESSLPLRIDEAHSIKSQPSSIKSQPSSSVGAGGDADTTIVQQQNRQGSSSRGEDDEDFQSLKSLSSDEGEDNKTLEIRKLKAEGRVGRVVKAQLKYLAMAVREYFSLLKPGSVSAETSVEELTVLLTIINLSIKKMADPDQPEMLPESHQPLSQSAIFMKKDKAYATLKSSLVKVLDQMSVQSGGDGITVDENTTPEELTEILNSMLDEPKSPNRPIKSPKRPPNPPKKVASPRKAVSAFY